jgi:ABC-type glycerol-3-phosphate transport system substrate-binding protein
MILAAMLAGCSPAAPANEPKTDATWDTAKKDKIVLSVINNYYTAGWKKMAQDYTALHPETEVIVDVVADNDTYLQKMTTWLTADDLTNAADIVHINFAQSAVGGYNVMVQKGLVYDMEPMLKETNPYNNNELVLIDEVLTADSSRFWPADSYQVGISPPSFDKQYVRDYLETLDWDKTPPAPKLPPR